MPLMEIDTHLAGAWHGCAELSLADSDRASRVDGLNLRYDADYAAAHLLATDFQAFSVRLPVVMAVHRYPRWPSFLIDLLP